MALDLIREAAIELDASGDVDAIVPFVANAEVVLIGEATHGTHEFYRARAELTRRLIERHGFNLVAVEADWPDAYRVNTWVRGRGADTSAEDALFDFSRFPRWLWRNSEVVRFLDWLHAHNATASSARHIGFYGLDLYSLHRSIQKVIDYLRTIDPAAALRARARYACFDTFGEDGQSYGYATARRFEPGCEREVIAQLLALQRRAADYASRDGRVAADDYFSAEQNARVVADAETYYRAMFGNGVESWNLRDRHMMSTFEALLDHVAGMNGRVRAVVWAHNSHLGDARATHMGTIGEVNLGQLARERFGDQMVSIGFTTHTGTVTAATDWEEPANLMIVEPSLPGSYERLFHDSGIPNFALDLRGAVRTALSEPRLERAIGVVYRPRTERESHYFTVTLPQQFDLVIHYDTTHALQPLERWSRHEVDLPETYPTGV